MNYLSIALLLFLGLSTAVYGGYQGSYSSGYKGSYNSSSAYKGSYKPPAVAKIDTLQNSAKRIMYSAKPTYIKGAITKTKIESSAQKPTTLSAGNCLDLAVYIAYKAKELGLKSEYRLEYKHISVIVTYKDGSKWRYSNGKRTWRIE